MFYLRNMNLTFFVTIIIIGKVKFSHEVDFVVFGEGNSNKLIVKRDANINLPKITEFVVKTTVANRFAETNISSKVENIDKYTKQFTFSVVLPENAFISGFFMEIDNQTYKAFVLEKEEANKIYTQSVSKGRTAAHVSVSTRNSNRLTINVNVEPESKVSFHLAYEELLQREKGQYEIIANIQPGQIVKKLRVEVYIKESRPLLFVRVPELRSGSGKIKNNVNLDPHAVVDVKNTSATVKFHPDVHHQLQFACAGLGNRIYDSFAGQFVVQYDVERDPQGGETLFQDGFFINFFAPPNLQPIPKHIVFVLDTSGSMAGTKIAQLKEAMASILPQLYPDDLFSIVQYERIVYLWNSKGQSFKALPSFPKYGQLASQLKNMAIPDPLSASKGNIEKAKNIINGMRASGGTNTIAALEIGLYVVKKLQKKYKDTYQPILVFITDGRPSTGIKDPYKIIGLVTDINLREYNVPIYSLCIGDDADWSFLQILSFATDAKSKRIHVDKTPTSDVASQLQDYYEKQLSTPVLSNVTFNNLPPSTQPTKIHFPVFFNGTEITIAGKDASVDGFKPITISARGKQGPLELEAKIGIPLAKLERVWAYLTVKQLLEELHAGSSQSNKTELSKLALDIALKYSLVTDMTSLIVVRPNGTNSAVNMQDASKGIFPASPNDIPMCTNITNWIITNFGTPELTTTEIIITTLKPTTQEPTTSKPTTTEKPTTTKPTTTEVITTLRPTTPRPTTLKPLTLKSTTLKPTTTQVPKTLEPITTQELTTLRSTTVKSSTTTTEKPTTKKPTTTEVITTLRPTTPRPTTLKPPTLKSTTLKPTTTQVPKTLEPITTQELTTLRSTTVKLSTTTTEKPTTKKPTTTEVITTLRPTTPRPTTLKATTLKATTSKPTTTQVPTTLELTTTQELTTLRSTTVKSSTTTTEKPTTKKVIKTLRPTTPGPTTLKPTTMKPTTLKPTTVKSTTLKPTTTQEPITLKPTSLKPTTLKPTTLKPTTQEPTTLKPTTIKPNTTTTEKPTTTITLTKIEPTPIQQTTTKTGYDFIGETEIGIAAATTTTKKPSTTERIKTCNETIFGCCHDRVTQAAGSNFLGCDPIPKSESCSLPQDSGACSNYTVKWRYDMVQGTCREFWYSGCGGNGNRFKSKDVCEKICVNPTSSDRCHLPIVLGRCAKYNLQWFYDKRKGECVKYLYSGCEGNSNRFDTRMECLQLCSPRNQNVSEQDACFLPKDGGTCSRYEPYFYFDRANGICRQFWYGGCGGNENRFKKESDCEQVCINPTGSGVCQLPHVKGPCKQAIRRWYYDRNSQTCTQFDYGGCHGNNNNFRTREECYSHCLNGSAVDLQASCFLKEDQGPCSQFTLKWSFNRRLAKCKQFWYGGCGGNANRFTTEAECNDICVHPQGKHRCNLPKVPGTICKENQKQDRWYYHRKQKRCHKFEYNGCLGNTNNFNTLDDCKKSCM